MVAIREDDEPPPEPGRSSKRNVVILVVVLVAGALFVTQVLPLLIVLWPRSQKPAQRLEDTNDLRNIAGLIIFAREDVPLAPDGRIDVYAILRQEKLGTQAIIDICHSSRAGKGPTWEEIEAGDYRNFPYQRHRGVLDRKSYVRVPVVWDFKPSEDRLARGSDDSVEGRLAAFSDASALFEEEAVFQEFFRNNPGQK